MNKILVAELDYTHVTKNKSVQAQGIVTCIFTENKGWFSPKLSKFVSRQDLAIKTNLREISLQETVK